MVLIAGPIATLEVLETAFSRRFEVTTEGMAIGCVLLDALGVGPGQYERCEPGELNVVAAGPNGLLRLSVLQQGILEAGAPGQRRRPRHREDLDDSAIMAGRELGWLMGQPTVTGD